MTDLQKLRDELLDKYGNASPALIGFDAAVEAMQAEINHLKYDNERIKLFNDTLLKERDLLKQALDVAVSAIKYADENCDISGLHKALTSINEIINSPSGTKYNGASE